MVHVLCQHTARFNIMNITHAQYRSNSEFTKIIISTKKKKKRVLLALRLHETYASTMATYIMLKLLYFYGSNFGKLRRLRLLRNNDFSIYKFKVYAVLFVANKRQVSR